MGNATTLLFGLPGVAVETVSADGGGARTVHVVTADPTAPACPSCGVFSTSVKQYRTTRPKDLPYGEAPLAVRWRKAQYRCREASCPRKAFTESIAELPPRARVTGRLLRFAARAIGAGRSVAGVAAELPISWPTAHDAFVGYAAAVVTEPAPPAVLGLDETRRGRPRWRRDDAGHWVKLERFETNFVDLAGEGGLLGQAAGRTGAAVVAWLDARGADWKVAVKVVAMDPAAGYRAAVERALPHARIVVDHFHLVRLANQTVTEVRQRAIRETHRRRGRRADPAWAHRRLLLRAGEQLRPGALRRLAGVFERADPTNEIGAAWGVKERLRQLLAARDRHTIGHRLHRFHEAVVLADLAETTRLAETVDAWWPEILAFLETGITNAATEGTNRLVKDAARTAFGFRNLENQRRRVRFHCTRQFRRTTSAEAGLPPQTR
ncbi:MAG TPA: ISL3 family transposase [Mycobacteriales bacterium]|nr:ISL3 family transposase [Mycobacteriales bacterium]